jgi:thioredoxin reductase
LQYEKPSVTKNICKTTGLITGAIALFPTIINLNSKSMNNNYEVIIIGGSYSGLSAAMSLGRALRKVLIIDSGKPCNRHTPHSHNFITQDGETPAAIAAKAKEQVLAYPTVEVLKDKAVSSSKTDTGFTVITEAGTTYAAKKLLFATGVTDIMPKISGFDDCWAISVIHCPYCHGYEVKAEKTAILANGDGAYHYAVLLSQWTKQLTIFTNGPAEFTEEQKLKIQQHNIPIIEGRIAKLKHNKGYVEEIIMQDSTSHAYKVIYSRPVLKQHCEIPEQIGCAMDEHGMISVDFMQKTNVPGIYASGDCTTMMRSVATAVASGMKAGAAINSEMATESF